MTARNAAATFAFFVAISIVHTWPLADLDGRNIFVNTETFLYFWAVNDTARQLVTDPTRPLDGRAFYPFPCSLASLDHLLSSAAVAMPLHLVGVRPAVIHNWMVILSFVLSGFFTCLLIVRLTGSWVGGLVGGSAFAFCTQRWNHVQHLHVLSIHWLPLVLYALHRVFDRVTWRNVAMLAVSALLLAYGSWNAAIVGGGAVAIAAILFVAAGAPMDVRRIAALAGVGALVIVALLPVYRAFDHVTEHWGDPRGGQEDTKRRMVIAEEYSLNLQGLTSLAPGVRSPYAYIAPVSIGESRAFPGFVPLALAGVALRAATGRRTPSKGWVVAAWIIGGAAAVLIVAVLTGTEVVAALLRPVSPVVALVILGIAACIAAARARTAQQRDTFVYTAWALCGTLLAFGPEVGLMAHRLGPAVYRPDLLPVLASLRTPARFVILLAVAVAVLAGIGTATWLERKSGRSRTMWAFVLVLLVNLELAAAPLTMTPLPQRRGTDLWLEREKTPGAVIYYPEHMRAVYGSLIHGRPVVNGLGLMYPREWEQVRPAFDLTRYQLNALWEHFHPRFLVLYPDLYEPDRRKEVLARVAENKDALKVLARDGGDYVFELIDRGRGQAIARRWPQSVLENGGTLHFVATVEPPRPDRQNRIVLTLNGKQFAAHPLDDAARPNTISQAVPREGLVEGSNTIELFPAYAFPDGMAGHAVGRTGTAVRADIQINSAPDRAFIVVNGRRFPADKGYLLVAIDPKSGDVLQVGRFNSSWYEEDSERLDAFVASLPDAAVVAVGTEYDVSRRLTHNGVAALGRLGLASDMRGRVGWAQAGIGVKGAPPGTAMEAAQHGSATLQLGVPDTPDVQLHGLEFRRADGRP